MGRARRVGKKGVIVRYRSGNPCSSARGGSRKRDLAVGGAPRGNSSMMKMNMMSCYHLMTMKKITLLH
jgi:hypothetical protein